MNPRVLAGCLLACLLTLPTGCRRQESAAPPERSVAPVEPEAAEAQTAALLAELTQAVRKFSVERRQVPKSLDELVAGNYLASVPPAPDGKKFAINKNLQVILENQ